MGALPSLRLRFETRKENGLGCELVRGKIEVEVELHLPYSLNCCPGPLRFGTSGQVERKKTKTKNRATKWVVRVCL